MIKKGQRRDSERGSIFVYLHDIHTSSFVIAEELSVPRTQFPEVPDLHWPSFSIHSRYSTAYTRTLFYAGRSNPHACCCPMLAGIAHVLLHFMEEWECYIGIRTLLQRQVWLDRTSAEVQSSVTTLCKLTATYLVS